jgi:predicted metal-dependent enzyme (double-stranded beta helix superfamily)
MLLSPPEADEPYGRNLLFASESEEILAMTWRAGATCAPHDHGAASGHVTVVRGTVMETVFVFNRNHLVATETRTHAAPTIIPVAPGTIHAMTALDDALTLHRYTPRIHAMRVWDANNQQTLVVSDDCGAWIPSDSARILAVEAWPPAAGEASR